MMDQDLIVANNDWSTIDGQVLVYYKQYSCKQWWINTWWMSPSLVWTIVANNDGSTSVANNVC